MVWSALIGAGAALLGGAARNRQQTEQAESANAFSAQQFAERYQTTTKDMMAAGLNPMLAYSQGASGPPTGQQAQIQDIGGPAVSAYQSASQSALIKSQIQKANAETKNIDADTQTKLVQPANVIQQTATSAADANLKGFQAKNVELEFDKIRHQIQNIYQDTFLKVNQGNVASAQVDVFKWTAQKVAEEVGNLQLTAKQIHALTANYLVENKLLTNQINQTTNMSEAQKSWYFQNIAPYLPDFLKSTLSLKSLSR